MTRPSCKPDDLRSSSAALTQEGYPGTRSTEVSGCPARQPGWLPRCALRPCAIARRVDSVAAGCRCFPGEAAGDSDSGLPSLRQPEAKNEAEPAAAAGSGL